MQRNPVPTGEICGLIALVAGEASGDQLGAALMRAIRVHQPDMRFAGIGGPLMKAEGMDSWWDSSVLSVMGLVEVISHLPRLLKLRRQLVARLFSASPDVFIGIDAPDFNLGVEKILKAGKIPVIHYVSPTVWAWRPGRVVTIAVATERVLCLFPFEPDYYKDQDVVAEYTGHPLADEIPFDIDKMQARVEFGIGNAPHCVTLLPGSRSAEVSKLSKPMLDAADVLTQRYPGMCFLMPAASPEIGEYLNAEIRKHPAINCLVVSGSAKQSMAAADVVICASGTATLETMLVNRPMVVCYRLAGLSYLIIKWFNLLKSRFFSLPNILASEHLVIELLQKDVNGKRIADEVCRWMDDPESREVLYQRFDLLHREPMPPPALQGRF